MKFYLIEISTYVDGTKDAKAIYEYDDLNSATAAFHQKLAGAMNNENYATEYCAIIECNDNRLQRYEYFVRPVDEPEEVEDAKKTTRKAVK